jgi:glycosyltransferase involved in cell wall biosynthesis
MEMKKILYIINVDWFFISHFLPLGQEAIRRGYTVYLACGITDKKEYLESIGFIVYPIPITRSGRKLTSELKVVWEIYRIIKSIKPDILECFTIKPVIYGGIVSKFILIPKKVFYITGLGYIFIVNGIKGFIVKSIFKILYKLAISGKNNSIITENIYDQELIRKLNAVDEGQVKIIRGAGVDLDKYKYTEENNSTIKVSMACRLIRDKGVFEYIQAVKILKQKFPDVSFELYGDIDIHNPTSLKVEDIKTIKKDGIAVSGFTNEIESVFSKANIVVLPSYREGLPKVLIEAAACARAVVTTDVPGCRDAIEPNVTGLLCKVADVDSLVEMIEKLIVNDKLRNDMGKAGRKLAEKEFDINKVIQRHFDIYENKL